MCLAKCLANYIVTVKCVRVKMVNGMLVIWGLLWFFWYPEKMEVLNLFWREMRGVFLKDGLHSTLTRDWILTT